MNQRPKQKSSTYGIAFALRLALCVMTISLAPPLTRLSYSAEAPEVKLIRVPPGWTATEEGYYLNVEALSTLTAAAKTYRLERDAWETAYYELKAKDEAFTAATRAQLSALASQINTERRAYRRARGPGFGVFAGAGYGTGGSVEAVVGVGVVWRVL